MAGDALPYTTNLVARWSASSCSAVGDGNAVTTWTDSVSAIAPTQATASRKPNYVASVPVLGGRPALQFTKGDQCLTTSSGVASFLRGSNAPFSVIVVACLNSLTTDWYRSLFSVHYNPGNDWSRLLMVWNDNGSIASNELDIYNAGGAVAYRSSSRRANALVTAPQSLTVPSGTTTDDITIVCISVWNEGGTHTLTGGNGTWSKFREYSYATTTGTQYLSFWWKRATGADSGSYTFGGWSGSQWIEACAISFSGISNTTTNPVEAEHHQDNTGTNNYPTVSVTTADSDPMLVFLGEQYTPGASTPPTNWTEVQDGSETLALSYRLPAASGTYSTSGGTGSVANNDDKSAHLIAISTTGAGGSPTGSLSTGFLPGPGPRPHVATIVSPAGSATGYLNGVQFATDASWDNFSQDTTMVSIGTINPSDSSVSMAGYIAEILVYSEGLSEANRKAVHGWVESEYGVPMNGDRALPLMKVTPPATVQRRRP